MNAKKSSRGLTRNLIGRIARRFGFKRRHSTIETSRDRICQLITNLRPRVSPSPLIRFGPSGDGGYLIPDDLSGIVACYSPGVNLISGFEKDCADCGMEVMLADKSVDGPAIRHEKFTFIKKYVGAFSNNDFITMDDWVGSTLADKSSDLLLQMDIEGFEYETLLGISPALLNRFRIIVLEFHWLDNLWSEPFFEIASRVFTKLLANHTCIHLHANNCCGSLKKREIELPRVMEFTFLRNDRIKDCGLVKSLPHPLDSDNTSKPSLPTPSMWYAS